MTVSKSHLRRALSGKASAFTRMGSCRREKIEAVPQASHFGGKGQLGAAIGRSPFPPSPPTLLANALLFDRGGKVRQ